MIGARCRIAAVRYAANLRISMAASVRTLAQQERRFALALFLPALLLLLLTTTTPLVYLAWTSLQRIDLSMPWLSGFAGVANYTKMASDPRFWSSLTLTVIYTVSTVALQVAIGLALALLVMRIPRGHAALRVAAILPIVLAPVVVGLFLRTLVLSPDVGLVDRRDARTRSWQPQLARRSAARADLGDRDAHVAVDAVRVSGDSREHLVACRPMCSKRRASIAPARGSGSFTSRCR